MTARQPAREGAVLLPAREGTMHTELGALFEQVRTSHGRTPQSLAAGIGYRNLNKGARRVERLERAGVEAPEFVERVALALGLDCERVAGLAARDEAVRHAAFEAWLAVPQPMEFYWFAVGIAFGRPLPEGLTEAETIAYVTTEHSIQKTRMCLVLDRRRSLWFVYGQSPYLTEAKMGQPNTPYTSVG